MPDELRAGLGRLLLGEERVGRHDAHLEASGVDAPRPGRSCRGRRCRASCRAALARCSASAPRRPLRTDASASGMRRSRASISAIVCSAAAIVLPVGALTTITPARVAASRSIRSIPTLATPTTLRRGAAASSSSASTRVCERTTSASQPPSSPRREEEPLALQPDVGCPYRARRRERRCRLGDRLDDEDAGHGRPESSGRSERLDQRTANY